MLIFWHRRQYQHRIRAFTQRRRRRAKCVFSRIGASTFISSPSLRSPYTQAATRHLCRSSQTSGHSLRSTPNRHADSLRRVHSARSYFSSANCEETGRGLRTVFSTIGESRSPTFSSHSDLALTLHAKTPASIRLVKHLPIPKLVPPPRILRPQAPISALYAFAPWKCSLDGASLRNVAGRIMVYGARL